jgi:hypothetical protein
MPFPIDEKYIIETEIELQVKFPNDYKNRMKRSNGGELISTDYEFELYPFFDKSDNKRISRTCNHIVMETSNALEWDGFPKNGIAIASDGFGNQVIMLHTGDGYLKEEIFLWDHETRQIEKIADSIGELEKESLN